MAKKAKLKKKVQGYQDGGDVRYLAPLMGGDAKQKKDGPKKWGEGTFGEGLADYGMAAASSVLAPITGTFTGKSLTELVGYDQKTKLGENLNKYVNFETKLGKIAAVTAATAYGGPAAGQAASIISDTSQATYKSEEEKRLLEKKRLEEERDKQLLMESIKYSPDQYVNADEAMANGGEIKGKGTAKSDSINAKVKPGSFVVPAENAGLAEVLRKAYLTDRNGPAKLNQGGGVPVKLSDGEHMFTPEEKTLLMAKGINVAALAPNAEDENMLAEGGDVVSKAEAAKAKAKQKSEETQKLASQWEKRQKAEEAQRKLKVVEKEIDKYTKLLEQTTPDQTISKSQIESQLNKALSVHKNLSKEFDDNAPDDMKAKSSGTEKNLINPKSYGSMAEALGGGKQSAAPDAKSLVETPVEKSNADKPTGTGVGTGKGSTKSGYDPTTDPSNPAYGFKGGKKEAANKFDYSVKPEAMQPRKGLNTPMVPDVAPEKLNVNTDLNKPLVPEKKKEEINKFQTDLRVSDMVGLAQLGIGLYSAKKDGARPEWQLDPDFNASVERSKADAMYGFDAATKQGMETDINTARLATQGLAAGYSGGDPMRAVAQSRAAANQYARNLVDLSAADSRLKLDKQRYSDSLIGQRANMRRQQFEDKLRAFEMNQQASAELINAGLSNVLGASEARRNEKMLADAYSKNKADNSAMFNEILKAVQNK